jgi:RHS repeat-associated protein
VLVKTEASGTQTYYVYVLVLIGQETGSEYTSYHFDYRGSTKALTDETGQVLERFQYSPYGLLLSGEASTTPFLFNGMYGVMTDSNGLYYMRARFYSPEMRRFVNQDILLGGITDGQSLNRYAYVTGQPVSYGDPFGLENFDFAGMGYPFGEPIKLNLSDIITVTIHVLDAIDLASDAGYACSLFMTGGTSITALPLNKLKRYTIAQIKEKLLKIALSEAKKFKGIAKLSVVLDKKTGEVFRGLSGTPYPEAKDVNKLLEIQLPKKSQESWVPLNCAEPKACNDALNDNAAAKLDKDLIMVTIELKRNIPVHRCKNCVISTDGVTVLTD